MSNNEIEKHLNISWLEIRQQISPIIEASILPIFTYSKKHRESPHEYIGTAFLLTNNGKRYLITAKHVYEAAKKNLYTLNSNNHLFKVDEGKNFQVIKSEEYDFVAIQFTDSKMFNSKKFLKHNNCFINPNDKLYVCGFPSSMNKSIKYKKTISPLGFLAKVKIEKTNNHSNRTIFMDYSNNFMNDDYSKFDNMLSPRGMSGSPIFYIGSALDIIDKKINQIQCIGVFTERNNDIASGLFLRDFLKEI